MNPYAIEELREAIRPAMADPPAGMSTLDAVTDAVVRHIYSQVPQRVVLPMDDNARRETEERLRSPDAMRVHVLPPPLAWDRINEIAHVLNEYAAQQGAGTRELFAARIVKISEEAGEVAAAWIGWMNLNPRKDGNGMGEIVKELCDVIVTSMVALATFHPSPEDAFRGHLAAVHERTLAAVGEPVDAEEPS